MKKRRGVGILLLLLFFCGCQGKEAGREIELTVTPDPTGQTEISTTPVPTEAPEPSPTSTPVPSVPVLTEEVKNAYLEVIQGLPNGKTWLYMELCDFDKDGSYELVLECVSLYDESIAVYTYKNKEVKKVAELVLPDGRNIISAYYKDNTLLMETQSAEGSSIMMFLYQEGEYKLGEYTEASPTIAKIDGKFVMLEELSAITSMNVQEEKSRQEYLLGRRMVMNYAGTVYLLADGEKTVLDASFDLERFSREGSHKPTWKTAYLEIMNNVIPYLYERNLDGSISQREEKSLLNQDTLYAAFRDFDKDGMEELLIGDTLSLAVFTFRDGKAVKLADLVMSDHWCPNAVFLQNNTVVLESDGSDGSGYTGFTYYEGQYYVGEFCEYHSKETSLNGEPVTYERFCEVMQVDAMDYEILKPYELERIRGIKEGGVWYWLLENKKQPLDASFDFDDIRVKN